MNDITGRVERGAALLDEKRPDWWQRIDLERLNISSACRCILGQLGGYLSELNSLGLREDLDSDIRYGFDGVSSGDGKALTEAWRTLITRRREMASVST